MCKIILNSKKLEAFGHLRKEFIAMIISKFKFPSSKSEEIVHISPLSFI